MNGSTRRRDEISHLGHTAHTNRQLFCANFPHFWFSPAHPLVIVIFCGKTPVSCSTTFSLLDCSTMGYACLPMPRHRHQRAPCVTSRTSNAIIAASDLIPASPPARQPELPSRFNNNENQPWILFNLLASRARHNITEDQMVLEALRVIRTLVDKYAYYIFPYCCAITIHFRWPKCFLLYSDQVCLPRGGNREEEALYHLEMRTFFYVIWFIFICSLKTFVFLL